MSIIFKLMHNIIFDKSWSDERVVIDNSFMLPHVERMRLEEYLEAHQLKILHIDTTILPDEFTLLLIVKKLMLWSGLS